MSKEKKPRQKTGTKEAKQEKAKVAKPAKPKLTRPTGPAPVAVVQARHGDELTERDAKGFSIGELEGAALSAGVAMKWGARIDLRRRSRLDGNVASLKKWAASAKAKPAEDSGESKPKAKRAAKKRES